jgi:outer membrane cobalamin receptor
MKFFVWLSTILVAISIQANEVILPEVEATADVSLADVAPADFPGDHQRIELQDHRYGSLLIENILERQAGIQVRHLGGKGQFVYPSIRGASGQQLQIIWDGIPLTNLNSSEGELPSIGFSVLKSIDIYRGIAPVELAPTAIGGTIHLVSKEHFDQSSSGEASLGTGSFSSHIGGVWQQWQDHSWQVFGALDWLQAENDFTHIQEINSYKNPNEPTKEKRLNNAASHRIGLFRINYRALKNWSPSLLIQKQRKKRELPGVRNIPDNKAFFSTDDTRMSFKLGYQQGGRSLKFITVFYDQKEIYDDKADLIGLGQQRDRYNTEGKLLKFNYKNKLPYNIDVVATLSHQQEDTEQQNDLFSQEVIKSNCLNGGSCPSAYNRKQSSIGTRLSWISTNGNMVYGQFNHLALKDKQNSRYVDKREHRENDHWVYDTGISLVIGQYLTLDTIYARQIRPVATRELFGDRGLTLGNPDLKNESSESKSVSLQLQHEHLTASVSGYMRTRDNAIVGSADSRGVIRYENLAQTEHEGFEFNGSIDLTKNLSLSGNSGWHNQKISKHDRPSFIGKRVPNQRTWDHNYLISYATNQWNISANYLRQSGGFYETTNLRPIKTRSQLGLSLSLWSNSSRLTLEANNLNNNRVSDFTQFPSPGRNYFIKFTQSW